MILTIRTDKPEAEIGVYSATGEQQSYHTWLAHRELSITLLTVIREQLAEQKAVFNDLTGIVVYQGPGSFTGLRIGITVANTIAYSLDIPIVGTTGENWQASGLTKLQNNHNDQIVMPEYGADAHITVQKK